MNAQDLKNSILQLAIQGKLVEQRKGEGTAKGLLEKIEAEKKQLLKEGKIKKQKMLPAIKEDEIPFDIPENWEWVRCSDVFNIRSASRIHKTDWKPTGIPFLRGRELVQLSKRDNFDAEIFIDEDLFQKFKEKTGIPLKDDLLISAVGTIGKVYIVKETDKFYYKDAYILCFENYGKLYSKYIRYMLESVFLQNQIKKDAMATTVAQLTIIKAKSLVMPLPPLQEQKRIVAKIEELMPYVEKYDVAYSEVDELNQKFPEDIQKSILQYAIQGKLVEQREEDGTAEELYKQIQEEKKRLIKEGKVKKSRLFPEITEDEIPFDIPENWKWVSVGQVCFDVKYGTSKKSSKRGKMPVLRMGNIQKGIIDYTNLVYSSDDEDIKKYRLNRNDLLFNRTNSQELVGKTAIYKGEIPAIYAGYLVKFTPVLISSDYLNFVMQSDYYWRYCQTVRSDAIGQSNINAEKLKQFVFPLPPLAEQKRIVAKIEKLLPYTKQLIR